MLQPVLDEINTGLTDIRGNLTRLESKIGFLSDQVEERNNTKDLDCSKSHISLRVLNNFLMQALADVKESIVNDELSRGSVESQLSAMNASITEELAAVESLVEAHNTSVVSRLDGQTTDHEIIHSSIDTLNSEHDAINAKLMTITSDLESVKKNLTALVEAQGYKCGGTFGWRRVVYLNMSDPNTNCPSGWRVTTIYGSKRLCRRVAYGGLSCDSVRFPVTGGNYTSVCGSVRAYQYGGPNGFEAYHDRRATTIDRAYITGVSLTHGTPREHIWTFAAGIAEQRPTWRDACPCDATIDIRIPPFVGGDYFCESGDNFAAFNGEFREDDPLWDGSGCNFRSNCCSFNNPPYFTKRLPNPTSDDIEARLCRLDRGDDAPVEFIELYVK